MVDEILQRLSVLRAQDDAGPTTTWFVVAPGALAARVAALPGAERVHADRASELWRVAARRCR